MPTSAITATANGSIGAVRTPTESTKIRPPWICRSSAAAIGERIEFKVQANSTLPGNRAMLTSDMQHAEQREEPPCRVEVDLDAIGKTLAQLLAAFIVQSAAAHIDRFDAAGARLAHGVVIAAADHEIVFDDLAERRERQHDLLERLVRDVANIE